MPRLVLGIRSSVGILALPFRPLYNSTSLLSFLLFLGDSHFVSCKWDTVHTHTMGQAKNNILFKRKPIVYLLSLICEEVSYIRGIKYDRIFIFINICKVPREV